MLIYLVLSEGITANNTCSTKQDVLSEEVQVYGSRAGPFTENKLSL